MDETLEHRRQEALAVAEQCAQILKSRFGARRVIPFGSVVGEGVSASVSAWRWRSMGVCPRENDGIRCYWAG